MAVCLEIIKLEEHYCSSNLINRWYLKKKWPGIAIPLISKGLASAVLIGRRRGSNLAKH